MNIKEKIEKLINYLNSDLYEREEATKLSLLALLSGESIFLLGPPGVGKSMVSRKIKNTISDSKNFEYLMNRFSTPDEIFGPISLQKLDEDKYERKIYGYLPDSEIAFLDEIWKASPSIQNTLLTIINEKIYRNGDKDINVPLLLLIAASNELPAQGEGLEALFDRFIIRLFVNNVSSNKSFKCLIDSSKDKKISLEKEDLLTIDEIKTIKTESQKITVDENTYQFIIDLKNKLNAELKENAPYISDRRWRKIMGVLKTSAYINNRDYISPSEWLLIQYMIWETEEQYNQIRPLLFDVWNDSVIRIKSGTTFTESEQFLDNIESNIKIEKTYSNYVKNIDGYDYYLFHNSNKDESVAIRTSNIKMNLNTQQIEPNQTIHYSHILKATLQGNVLTINTNIYYDHNNQQITNGDLYINGNKFSILKKESINVSKNNTLENENQLNEFFKIISNIQSSKQDIIMNLRKSPSLFLNCFDYNIDNFSILYDDKLSKLINRRDELKEKISNKNSTDSIICFNDDGSKKIFFTSWNNNESNNSSSDSNSKKSIKYDSWAG